MLGRATVAMGWDVAPEMRDEFEDWHTHEHMPERLAIPTLRRRAAPRRRRVRCVDHARATMTGETGPYRVVARRFRPRTFAEMVGQDDAGRGNVHQLGPAEPIGDCSNHHETGRDPETDPGAPLVQQNRTQPH